MYIRTGTFRNSAHHVRTLHVTIDKPHKDLVALVMLAHDTFLTTRIGGELNPRRRNFLGVISNLIILIFLDILPGEHYADSPAVIGIPGIGHSGDLRISQPDVTGWNHRGIELVGLLG